MDRVVTVKTASRHQLLYFDLIRGFSAQMVVVGHSLNIFLPLVFVSRQANGSFVTTAGVFYVQNMGVILFFVLSGFLVTRSVVYKRHRPEYGFGMYLVERFTRLFVPFVPAVLLVGLFDRILVKSIGSPFTQIHLDLGSFAGSFLMLFNHPAFAVLKRITGLDATVRPLGTAAPFWSVAIEWWIYITFGMIMFRVAAHRRLGLLGWAVLLFAGAVPLWSLVSHRGLLLALLAWIVGMAYSLLETRVNRVGATRHRIAASFGLVLASLILIAGNYNVNNEIFVLSLSVAVMSGYYGWFNSTRRQVEGTRSHVHEGHQDPSRFVRFLRFVSDYSYSLYLIHFSILIYISARLSQNRSPAMMIVGGVILCNIMAMLFWFTFERHYPKARRFLSSRYLQFLQYRQTRIPGIHSTWMHRESVC
jgi:peptidoglycan/LPS O-acetylase OafA/YrhL